MIDSPKSVPLIVHIERLKKYTKRKKELELSQNKEDDKKLEILRIIKKCEIPKEDSTIKTEYRVRWKDVKIQKDVCNRVDSGG